MGKLSQRQIDWWEAQPDEQTCADCGKVGPRTYVQPQYRERAEGVALCCDCIVARNRQYRTEHKAALAAMDRCEVDGCNHRGNWRLKALADGCSVLMCGRHKKRCEEANYRSMARASPVLAMLYPRAYSRADLLAMARGIV